MSENQVPEADETTDPEVVAHTAEGNEDDPCSGTLIIIEN